MPTFLRSRWFMLGAALALALNLCLGAWSHSQAIEADGSREGYRQLRQFAEVLGIIRRFYVDEDKVDYTRLVHGALDGMLSDLDPFSAFIPPTANEAMKEQTDGEFGGVGMYVSPDLSVTPMPDSPAARAGVLPGDQIRQVDGTDVQEMPLREAVKLIKGEEGSKVEILFYRPGEERELLLTLERRKIQLDPVRNVAFVEPGLAYLEITIFNEKTADSLKRHLGDLEDEQELRGLIIDLRHNPGGLLETAAGTAEIFLPAGQLIVETEARHPGEEGQILSGGGRYLDLPLVVLVNEQSASGSEIVAACLQDYERATLVGEKTFGKGSVQQVIDLSDGSAVRLTVAKYFTKSHRLIHGQGIEPDEKVEISDEESNQLMRQRSLVPGLPLPPDFQKIPDPQRAKALEILRAKTAAALTPEGI